MKCKKAIAMIMMLAVVLAMLTVTALPVSAAASTITIVNTTVTDVSTVTVDVKVTGKIAAFGGTIVHDTSKLTLTKIENTGALKGLFVSDLTKKSFAFANASNTTLNNAVVLKLSFSIKSGVAGAAKVNFEDDLFVVSEDGKIVTSEVKAGTVNILRNATKITAKPTSMQLTKGTSATLAYTLTPSYATDKITFSSSDTKVATVNKTTGLIQAKDPGVATITMQGAAKSATCKVTVHNYVSLRVNYEKAIQNGVQTQVDDVGTKPFILDGRTMLPLRFVGEKMGGKVKYVSISQPIVMTYGTKKVEFLLNSKTMTVYTENEKTTVTLDVAAQLRGEKTYIPLRAIGQALGFQVYYEAGSEIIIVNTPQMTSAVKTERLNEARDYIK